MSVPGDFHSIKIMGIAVLDVLGTVAIAYMIYINYSKKIPLVKILFYLFLTGIVFHELLGIRTPVNKALFGHSDS
jgi:succinate dehydrogenase/fumarate reductase cytochrome b subunit